MPVSTSCHISHCLNHILELRPKSVLDIGCGFGLWGFLCREYLDAFNERVYKKDWQVRITGVELFGPYIQDHQRALYDEIVIADVREAVSTLPSHELVIAGDVIEHLDKHEAVDVLRQLYDKAERALLVNIPLGEGWEHGVVHDNPGELHRSQWDIRDFEEFLPEVKVYQLPCGQYGSFFCPKNLPAEKRTARWIVTASRCEAEGDSAGLVANLRLAHRSAPAHVEISTALANLLLQQRDIEGGLNVLRTTVSLNPGFHHGSLAIAQTLAAVGRAPEGRPYLEALLNQPDLQPQTRETATQLLARTGNSPSSP